MRFSSYYMDLTGHVSPNQMHESDVPVVVIDPEDCEQVERLVKAFVRGLPDVEPCTVGRQDAAMQEALRSLIAPPKPEEPKGRWAVVEGRDGNHWVRDDASARLPWRHIGPVDRRTSWEGIVGPYAAVKVLSEGVTR